MPLDVHDTQDAIAVKRALSHVFLLVGSLRMYLAQVALVDHEASFSRSHLNVAAACFIGKREVRFGELGLSGIVPLICLSLNHTLAT